MRHSLLNNTSNKADIISSLPRFKLQIQNHCPHLLCPRGRPRQEELTGVWSAQGRGGGTESIWVPGQARGRKQCRRQGSSERLAPERAYRANSEAAGPVRNRQTRVAEPTHVTRADRSGGGGSTPGAVDCRPGTDNATRTDAQVKRCDRLARGRAGPVAAGYPSR